MIWELPEGIPAIYYHGINLYINIFGILLFIVFGLLLIFRHPENSTDIQNRINLGYGLFSIFYAGCRIFFIIGVWYPNESWSSNSYDSFTVVGYFFAAVGMTSIIFVVEKYFIPKTKHLFSVLGIIISVIFALGIMMIVPRYFALYLSYISSPFLLAVLIILYLYLAVKGTASIRKNAITIIVAILLMGLAAVIDGEFVIKAAVDWFNNDIVLLEIFYSIPNVMLIIGITLFYMINH
ncbi:MAG: hypothetical protein ACTSVI_00550 [Promethearchaeota archaeon]